MSVPRTRGRSAAVAAGFAALALVGTAFLATADAHTSTTTSTIVIPSTAVVAPGGDDAATVPPTVARSPRPVRIRPVYTG